MSIKKFEESLDALRLVETRDLFIIGVHPNTFRCGEIGMILDIKNVLPDPGMSWRPAVRVIFADGAQDYICLSDIEDESYKIGSFGDLKGLQ